jgi:hypothetical protein
MSDLKLSHQDSLPGGACIPGDERDHTPTCENDLKGSSYEAT